jgi:pimeloyl-ACP methyl ester carboxylesterase
VPREIGAAVVGPLLGAMGTPGWNRALRDFMAASIGPHDDPDRSERILAAMEAFPARIGEAEVRSGLGGWDAPAAISACAVPALYVQGAVPADLALLRQLCPQIVIGTTVGSGHWVQLEVPEQVNAMIERFLRVVASPALQRAAR